MPGEDIPKRGRNLESKAGGIGVGTLIVHFAERIKPDCSNCPKIFNIISTDCLEIKHWLIILAPSLAFVVSFIFQLIRRKVDFFILDSYIKKGIEEYRKQLNDPHISASKKTKLQKEYDELCTVKARTLVKNIKKID
ncbi:MAG: hypothetical protein J7604_03490 [Sporocytophaga sp.]|uniref:hypothetical protein n=1 Tax=Sporocytophaga sp. TaxID=2231183 RepID=UPI001B1CA3A3|nr:hypothetical protein [Sporocytophaga sp.]MBO9699244.1 hypothetical protein [Sporocytophaga sp.]